MLVGAYDCMAEVGYTSLPGSASRGRLYVIAGVGRRRLMGALMGWLCSPTARVWPFADQPECGFRYEVSLSVAVPLFYGGLSVVARGALPECGNPL